METEVTGMADLYVTRTEQYAMGQDDVSRRLADFLEAKLQAGGLAVSRTETTNGITVSGTRVICLGGGGDGI